MVVKKEFKIGRTFTLGDTANNTSGLATRSNFNNLTNLLSNDNVMATANVTANNGQTPRPRIINATNFGFNFPDKNTAIRGVEAQWEDYVRNNDNGTKGVPNISNTTLRLLNIPGSGLLTNNGIKPTLSGTSIGGIAVTPGPYDPPSIPVASTETTHYAGKPVAGTITGTPPAGIEVINNTIYTRWGTKKITAEQVMSANFGVSLDYAKNNGTYHGKINLDYIALNIYYENPEYSLTVAQTGTILKDGNFNVTITIKNTNNANNGVPIPVSVVLPAGVEYVSHNTGTNNVYGTYDRYNNNWQAKLTGPNGSAVLNLTLKATTTGVKQVKATEFYTKKAANGSTNVIVDTYTIKTNFPSDINLTRGQDFSYTVTVETNQDLIKNKVIDLPLNDGILLTKYSSPNCTYDIKTGKWNVTFINRKATITFYLTIVAPGDFEQTITLGNQVFTQNFSITSQPVTHCSYSIIEPPESFFQFLEDGETYTLSAYCTVTDTYLNSIFNGLKNNRLGVLIGQDEILGTRCYNTNSIEEIYVEFIYNENLPLKIIVYGQYLELDLTNSMIFGAWQLKKGPYEPRKDYENPVILFSNLQSLIENVDYTETIIPSRHSTATYSFKDINFGGLETDPTLVKRGIGICFDYEIENKILVEAQLHSDKSTNKRSIILDSESNFAIMGDLTEKWGLKTHEINLNRFSFTLKFINSTIENQLISIKNVNLILFYEQDITEGARGFLLDGEHSREHGIFVLPDSDDVGGANNKIDRLNLKGSDGELGTGSSIEAKTISIPFEVEGDTLEEAEILFQKVIQWLTKDRDKRLIPAKQELVLDEAPNVSYLVIADGAFKKKKIINTIESQVDFLVLDGVGFSRQPKITGPTGVNNGLTTAYPLLNVVCLGGPVKIVESVDQQEMILTSTLENGRKLIIDCNKRTVFDDLGNDHTAKVNLSWGYFGLIGDYDFSLESENCIVEEVIFKEGIA